MSDLWYYGDEGNPKGPATFAELIDALSRLPDPRKVPVWNLGLDDWKPAEAVKQVAERLFRPPPLKNSSESATRQPFDDSAVVSEDLNRESSLDAAGVSAIQIREPTVDASEVSNLKVTDPLTGVAGWLILVALGQVISVLKLLGSLSEYFSKLDPKLLQQFPVTFYGEIALNVATLALFLYTTVLFFKRSSSFPQFYIYEWIVLIFLPIVDIVWGGFTLSIATGRPFSELAKFGSEELAQSLGAAVGAAIWISYILKSKRVANTFTR
jgi:hypothetical protein